MKPMINPMPLLNYPTSSNVNNNQCLELTSRHPLGSWSTVREKLSQWQFIPNPWYEGDPPVRRQYPALTQDAAVDGHDYQCLRGRMELPPIPQENIYESIQSIKGNNTTTRYGKESIIKAIVIATVTILTIGIIAWLCVWVMSAPSETPIKRNKRAVPETTSNGLSTVMIKIRWGTLILTLNRQQSDIYKLTLDRDDFQLYIDHSRMITIKKRGIGIKIDLSETLNTLQRIIRATTLLGRSRKHTYTGREDSISFQYEEPDVITYRLDFYKPPEGVTRSVKTIVTPTKWVTRTYCGTDLIETEEETQNTKCQTTEVSKLEKHEIKKITNGKYSMKLTTPGLTKVVVFAKQMYASMKPANPPIIYPLDGYFVTIVHYLSDIPDLVNCNRSETEGTTTERPPPQTTLPRPPINSPIVDRNVLELTQQEEEMVRNLQAKLTKHDARVEKAKLQIASPKEESGVKIEAKLTAIPILAILLTITMVVVVIKLVKSRKRDTLPISQNLRDLKTLNPAITMPQIDIWEITDPKAQGHEWSKLANIGWTHRGTEV